MIIYLYISEELVVGDWCELEAPDTEGAAPRRARLPVVQREQARHQVVLLLWGTGRQTNMCLFAYI